MAWRSGLIGCGLAIGMMASQLPPAYSAPPAPERSQLANGITVVTRQRPASQVVAVDFVVRAGARYEDEDTSSAAHMLEHVLMLGTQKRPSRDQLLRSITSRGGDLGATAGREILEVPLTIALPDLELGLDVLRDVVTASLFDERAFEAERQVVLHELDDREDEPETQAGDVLADTIFDGHPLRHRPTGTREGVIGLSAGQIRQFWIERLVGGNIAIVVVSGLEHASVVERLAASFGDLPAGPLPPRNLAAFPVAGPKQTDLSAGSDQAHIFVGAPVSGVGSADRAALRIAKSVLSRASGRLYTEIRDKRGLAYSTYAALAQYVDGGLFYVYAGTEGGNADTVLALLHSELARLREQSVGDAELNQAIGAEIGSQIVNEEASGAEAGSLARAEMFGTPPREVEQAQLRAVTAADVQRVARTYLAPDRLTVVMTRPGEEAER